MKKVEEEEAIVLPADLQSNYLLCPTIALAVENISRESSWRGVTLTRRDTDTDLHVLSEPFLHAFTFILILINT